jgi:tRNA(Ile)-lysidine synthase
MFIRKVSQFIEEKHLLGFGDKVLVALSGGADSVALLRVLLRLGYACEAAHCNFHLRGEESVRDERFVRALAESLGVPLHVIHFDTNAYAASHNVSVEMAARELRYDWFAKLRQECGAKVVAVAHHRDDSVETYQLNKQISKLLSLLLETLIMHKSLQTSTNKISFLKLVHMQ